MKCYQGDYGVSWTFYLYKHDNTPYDLTEATTVTLVMNGGTPITKITRICSIIDPAVKGGCYYTPISTDRFVPGWYDVQITVVQTTKQIKTTFGGKILIIDPVL